MVDMRLIYDFTMFKLGQVHLKTQDPCDNILCVHESFQVGL